MQIVLPGKKQSSWLGTVVLQLHACGLIVPSGSAGSWQSFGTHICGAQLEGSSQNGFRVASCTLQ